MKAANLKKQVLTAVEAAHAKQAQNLVILELPAESSAFTDYFVVCSGSNPRQVQAICDEVDERLSKAGMEPNHREGYDVAEWVLLDYVDFVIHVFSENARKFYDLERLWKSASPISEADLKSARKPVARATEAPVKSPAKKAAKKSSVRTAAKKSATPRKAAKSAAKSSRKKK